MRARLGLWHLHAVNLAARLLDCLGVFQNVNVLVDHNRHVLIVAQSGKRVDFRLVVVFVVNL